MTIAIPTALERLIEVQTSHRPLAPLSETHGAFTLDHAYAIQDALRVELGRRGQGPIGRKLGATSPSGQAVMGVKEPAAGFLMPLVWLANHLATRGLALRPGDVVMAGAISRMLRPKAGDTIRARFAHLGSVGVSVVR